MTSPSSATIRLSVTELDSYRRWRDNEHDDEAAALADLLAQLRKETTPTVAMRAGSAWHKALERAANGEPLLEPKPTLADENPWITDALDTIKQDGFSFRIVGDIELTLPLIAELKGEMEIPTPSGLVTLVGVVDGIDWQGIHDYKLSGYFEAERYTDAYQWRCYLLMFHAERFIYDVFVAREDARSGDWLVSDYQRLPVCAYPGLRADVEREVADFAGFISRYLPERVRLPEGAAA